MKSYFDVEDAGAEEPEEEEEGKTAADREREAREHFSD